MKINGPTTPSDYQSVYANHPQSNLDYNSQRDSGSTTRRGRSQRQSKNRSNSKNTNKTLPSMVLSIKETSPMIVQKQLIMNSN